MEPPFDERAATAAEIPADAPEGRPTVRLLPGRRKRARAGHPWIYSNEIDMTAEARALPPGTLVKIEDGGGGAVGTATFNPHPLISARMLSRSVAEPIDAAWLGARLRRALEMRERLFDAPYYRLVHSEADGLPGLIADRYGDVLVVQVNTAGMERLTPLVVEAIQDVLAPATVILWIRKRTPKTFF